MTSSAGPLASVISARAAGVAIAALMRNGVSPAGPMPPFGIVLRVVSSADKGCQADGLELGGDAPVPPVTDLASGSASTKVRVGRPSTAALSRHNLPLRHVCVCQPEGSVLGGVHRRCPPSAPHVGGYLVSRTCVRRRRGVA